MEKLSSNMNSIRPSTPEIGARGRLPSQREQDVKGPGFREQLSALQQQLPTPSINGGTPAPSTLKFSNHAIDRMQSRGIRFSPDELGKIQGAVSKAAGKGSKDALLITDNAALIVSVKDNTVVTVMDKASLKDNVFTKIDSTVMI